MTTSDSLRGQQGSAVMVKNMPAIVPTMLAGAMNGSEITGNKYEEVKSLDGHEDHPGYQKSSTLSLLHRPPAPYITHEQQLIAVKG